MTDPTATDPSDNSQNGDSAQTTKERLLSVALGILENEGASAITIRRVAEGGNVSVSVVHHHYVNKQGLLDACKSQFFATLKGEVAKLLASIANQELDATIEQATRVLFRHARKNIRLLRLLAGDIFAEGDTMEEFQGYDARPFLAIASAFFAPKLGVTENVARFRIQAMTVVVTRYAISSVRELTSVVGGDPETVEEGVEELLVDVAKRIMM